MFGLFKKSSGVIVSDKIWISTDAKWRACAEMLAVNAECMFVAWFEETFHELKEYLALPDNQRTLLMASQLPSEMLSGRMVIFIEHYPLAGAEQDLFKRLGLREVPVLTALDESFMQHFGGEKTIELMKKLGVTENEVISHSMVSKSIRRAQEKLASRVTHEKSARSQSEWMALNLQLPD